MTKVLGRVKRAFDSRRATGCPNVAYLPADSGEQAVSQQALAERSRSRFRRITSPARYVALPAYAVVLAAAVGVALGVDIAVYVQRAISQE